MGKFYNMYRSYIALALSGIGRTALESIIAMMAWTRKDSSRCD